MKRRAARAGIATVLAGAVLGVGGPVAERAAAGGSTHGLPTIVVNPSGGALADGSDGIRIELNTTGGEDQVHFAGTYQYCCSAAAPMLNVGGTLFGEAGPAYSSTSWTSVEIVATGGSTTTTGGTGTGSGTTTVRYTAEKNGLTYVVERALTYTFPNDYFTDAYTFTIPVGNTEEVTFYQGGDTAPGSSDSGYGIMLTSPVRSVISLNTSSRIQFGYREVAGSEAFDGATSQPYYTPYETVEAGGDIGFVVTASTHDAGLMMQWDLGSTPGTQTASMETFVNEQGTNLSAGFRAATTDAGVPVLLDLSIVNTDLAPHADLGFTFALPAGLVVGADPVTNGCAGTLTAAAGGTQVALAGGAVGATTNCVVSVPVVAASPGSYAIGSASVTSVTGLTNIVGSSTLTVTGEAVPPPPPPPPPAEVPRARPVDPCPALLEHGFVDTATTVHQRAIDCIAWWGIASGTGDDAFEPGAPLTRGQAASLIAQLLARTTEPLPPGPDAFGDDDGDVHEAAIDALAAAGIVVGVEDDRFGPSEPVTRGQLVSMVVAAYQHVTGTEVDADVDAFADDDGNAHEGDIDAAFDLGFALGTGERRFEPDELVTRGQAATFAMRLFAQLNGEGEARPT